MFTLSFKNSSHKSFLQANASTFPSRAAKKAMLFLIFPCECCCSNSDHERWIAFMSDELCCDNENRSLLLVPSFYSSGVTKQSLE